MADEPPPEVVDGEVVWSREEISRLPPHRRPWPHGVIDELGGMRMTGGIIYPDGDPRKELD